LKLNSNTVILFTAFEEVENEIEILDEMLSKTSINLHVKKAVKAYNKDGFADISSKYPNRVVVHTWNSPLLKHGARYRKSVSCHSWSDVELNEGQVQYFFLSPFFDSISKKDYSQNKALHDKEEIKKYSSKLVALGGINEDKFGQLKELGISHIALLGAIWNNETPVDELIRLEKEWQKL
jgi:hypothetical protein